MTIEEQFNQIAQDYDSNRKKFIPCFEAFYKETTAFIASYLTEPKSILDLGAGTGLLSYFWYQQFPNAHYTLVDIASDMLHIAEQRFLGLSQIEYRLEDYIKAFPKGTFDCIISALSIHHLESYQKEILFKNIYYTLPQNGIFVNYDQFCADTSSLSPWFDTYWETALEKRDLTENDIALWKERRKLDKECSVKEEMAQLRKSNFKAVECVYKNQKFAVIIAIK